MPESFVKFSLTLCLTLLSLFVSAYSYACESGHWISQNIDAGEIIQLEDGTLWAISSMDRFKTAIWLPTEEIVVCDNMLINPEENETAGAVQIIN